MLRLIQRVESILDKAPESFKGNVQLFELNRRFIWFILARFFVVSGFIFLSIFKPFLFPRISVTPHAFLLMAAFLFISNILYWFYYRATVYGKNLYTSAKKIELNVQIQVIFDFIVLGYLVYRCGGIESPLVYFFLFHNIISCMFFKKRISFLYTILSLCIIYSIALGPFLGFLAKHHFIHLGIASEYFDSALISSYHLSGITIVFLILWLCVAGITDNLKHNEKRLQDKIDELIETDKEKTRYLLVTTHELKAPFSSIQSYVNVLLAGYAGDIPDKVKDVLLKIKTRCDLLLRMITKMLQLSNLSSLSDKKDEITMAYIDLAQILKIVIDHFGEMARDKNVEIVLSGKEREHKIPANAEQIDILFNNILSNAIGYCYPDTTIDISIRETVTTVLVKVIDRGIGINKKDIQNVFMEYFRTEKASLLNKSSTGLGLSICKRIMEIHNGKIWIESEEGKETTVFVEFPR